MWCVASTREHSCFFADCVLGVFLGQTGRLSAFPAPTWLCQHPAAHQSLSAWLVVVGLFATLAARAADVERCQSHLALSELWCKRAAVCCWHLSLQQSVDCCQQAAAPRTVQRFFPHVQVCHLSCFCCVLMGSLCLLGLTKPLRCEGRCVECAGVCTTASSAASGLSWYC